MFFLLILLFFILNPLTDGATSIHSSASDDHIQVQLLGINDLHGQLDKYQTILGNQTGGAEYLAAYLKKYKQENENTLLVHAGDMVGGSPPISSLFQDEPTIEYLNMLKFDVGTPGNHEFDEGVYEMRRLIYGGVHKNTGYFSGSSTSYSSANVIDKKTGKLLLPPYTIKKINGIPIGFIGVVTTETTKFLLPETRNQIEITDEVTAINKTVQILKDKGIKSIVVLAHIPVTSNWFGGNADGDLAKMAPMIDDEVDIMFAGHNHKYANTIIDKKLVVQAYSYGSAFSQVQLTIDTRTKDIVDKKAAIIPTTHHNIEPDQETVTLLEKYKKRMGPYVNKIVGTLPSELAKKKNLQGDFPLAKAVAESGQMALDTDMAFFHHGGVRSSLPKGTITMEDLYTVLPFDQYFVKLRLTGDQIKQVLEQQWLNDKENRIQEVGITYTVNQSAPIGNRIVELKDSHGQELQPKKKYTVATSNYLATGGDGFTAFTQGKQIKKGPTAVDTLAKYIKKKYPSQ